MDKVAHFLHIPFTGLGLYNGFRGNNWLKNRIKVFKQFVVPSLQNQSIQDMAHKGFVIWLAFRYEEKNNPQIKELKKWLDENINVDVVFTFSGICFYDDKYPDEIARNRLLEALHGSMGEILNVMGEAETVLMSIQPSDDCYRSTFVNEIQSAFRVNPKLQAIGYDRGYICDYKTLEIKEYNPQTNPPFYTIKFPRDIFIEPFVILIKSSTGG